VMPDEWTCDPGLRQRYRFHRPPGEDVLEVSICVDPGGGVTPHRHPAMEERFEVLAGRAHFLRGRRWRPVGPGQSVVVAAGVRHAYRNRGAAPVEMRCRVTPPSSLQAFLEEAAALGRAGALTRRAFPKSLGALLAGADLADRHREMVVLLFPPFPPGWVQRLLIPPLARIARRRSERAARAAAA
jgi:quercetin dioxygenase-like cupin family protein